MAAISSSVGLISGLNTGDIIDALVNAQRATANRLQSRQKNFENRRIGYQALEASLLSVTNAADTLSKTTTFTATTVSSADPAALTATARSGAPVGTVSLQPLRRATANVLSSRGYANADTKVGSGDILIARGGDLEPEVALSSLNNGSGVRLGSIRITDRAGVSSELDLSTARTVRDVLTAVNASGTAVTASTSGGALVLRDNSGGSGNLAVRDLAGGHAAADLGIAASVASGTLAGSAIETIGRDTALSQVNDGNGPRFSATGADLRVSLADGTAIDVELSAATNIGDLLDAVNSHADNVGKLTATVSNGRLVLQDNTTGSGTLGVADINGSSVARALGLETPAAGATLTGGKLTGGLGSVLLKNLRGGAGITQAGAITLTDRSGATATLDLSAAETLEDVLGAINAAQTAGGQKLSITAGLDDAGLGLVLRDTSGATAANLTVADVGTGTTAADLGLNVDAATDRVRSGSLGRRYVNETTALATYGPAGRAVGTGSFRITDSTGAAATVTVDTNTKSLGDVIDRINAAGIGVQARLNDTGDGLLLADTAAGSGSLTVANIGSATAASDLKIAGTGVLGNGGNLQISGRQATVVSFAADASLGDIAAQLTAAGAGLSAQTFSDGSGSNGVRLLVTASKTGSAARLRIDDGGLDLGLSTIVTGQDALLRVGADAATGIVLASATNQFNNVPGKLNVNVLQARAAPVEVSVSRDDSAVTGALSQLVGTYNQFLDTAGQLTKFDLQGNQRGVLQGDGTVLRVQQRIGTLLSGRYGSDADIRSLTDLGVSFTATGRLSLDETKLAAVLTDKPEAVQTFFSEKKTGFGVRAAETIKALTNPLTGTFHLQDEALSASITNIEKRVTALDAILDVKKDRLIRQFANLESILGTLQGQQNALGSLANLAQQARG